MTGVQTCALPISSGFIDTFRYFNPDKADEYTPLTITASGLMARCIQHETDHLDGVLFLRRLTSERRKEAMAYIRQADWFNK